MNHNWKVDLLRDLVGINSGSNHIDGVNQVQLRIAAEFERRFSKHTGFQIRQVKDSRGAISLEILFGVDSPSSSAKFLTLVAHADTVFERDSDFVHFKLGDVGWATGPGVIDDKGGIVIALAGLTDFLSTPGNALRHPIRFLCMPSEELGSPGYFDQLQTWGRQASLVLGFEPSTEDGSLVQSRRGNRWYEISVVGRPGHAGRDGAVGLNAARELVSKLHSIQASEDPAHGLDVNISSLSTDNQKFNIICSHASAKLDVRFSTLEQMDSIHHKIISAVNTSYLRARSDGTSTRATMTLADDCPPFTSTPLAHQLGDQLCDLVSSIEGRRPSLQALGGASDCNYMSQPNLTILDGLGAVGAGLHTKDERILLSSLDTRAEALSKFLHLLNGMNL